LCRRPEGEDRGLRESIERIGGMGGRRDQRERRGEEEETA
jgi:hypothetical protein